LVPSVDSLLAAQFPGQHQRERIIHGIGSVILPFGSIVGTSMYADRSSSMSRGAAMLNQYFAVGVEELLADEAVYAYPNPAIDRLYVAGLTALSFPVQSSIYDMQGRRILQNALTFESVEQGIDLTALPDGMYLLQLRDEQGRQQQLRFVKK
jgi:hypothetical protein